MASLVRVIHGISARLPHWRLPAERLRSIHSPKELSRRDRVGKMLTGSCACGRVTYEVRGSLLGPITYCHCWRCRKHSGSSFGTTAGVAASDLKFSKGEELKTAGNPAPGCIDS